MAETQTEEFTNEMTLRRERRIAWDLLVKPADHVFILLKLGDEDVGVTLKLASHPIMWTLTIWSSIMACDDIEGGRFLCTINMKSYEILDLASHFSRKDGGWGRVETPGHPWSLMREPLSLRPKTWLRHPRPPTRAAPARHKTRTHQKGRVGREPACGQSIQRYARSGPCHLHEETKLRALCFGFS